MGYLRSGGSWLEKKVPVEKHQLRANRLSFNNFQN